jgi:hypothetical protein
MAARATGEDAVRLTAKLPRTPMVSEPTSGAWPQIRYEYEETDKPVELIALDHRVSAGTIRDRVRRWGWTPRRMAIPHEGPPPPSEPVPLPHATPGDIGAPSPPAAPESLAPPPGDDGAIALRLQAALARVVPAIEATVTRLGAGPTHPREMERAARALPALTRALRELKALMGQYPAPANHDRGPEDPDEFVLELARRMDAFAAAHAARAASTRPEGSC